MFVAITDALSQKVEQQKMRTIGVQTALKSMTKQRANQQQELQVTHRLGFCWLFLNVEAFFSFILCAQNKIMERTLELERLKIELQYLQRVETEQQEVLDNLYQA